MPRFTRDETGGFCDSVTAGYGEKGAIMIGRRLRLLGFGLAMACVVQVLVAAAPSASPADTCAVKSKPSGKVLQGYWENWDGAANGVHPPFGWTPITDPRIRDHGYNVINAAFPVTRPDGTVLWEDGMDATVKVATPAEMCQAKAAGLTVLMSIGGATAGIDLSSSTVADRFVQTVVPILKAYDFDGIDIDIETGLIGSGNINQLSASQANLVRIIDGVLAPRP
jgi:chitinase